MLDNSHVQCVVHRLCCGLDVHERTYGWPPCPLEHVRMCGIVVKVQCDGSEDHYFVDDGSGIVVRVMTTAATNVCVQGGSKAPVKIGCTVEVMGRLSDTVPDVIHARAVIIMNELLFECARWLELEGIYGDYSKKGKRPQNDARPSPLKRPKLQSGSAMEEVDVASSQGFGLSQFDNAGSGQLDEETVTVLSHVHDAEGTGCGVEDLCDTIPDATPASVRQTLSELQDAGLVYKKGERYYPL